MRTRAAPRGLWLDWALLLACLLLPGLVGAQTVQLAKTSTGGTGTFSYTMTNLVSAADSITTTSAGVSTPSALVTEVIDNSSAVTITEAANAQFTLTGASCVDSSGTVPGTFGVLLGRTLTIGAANLVAGVTLVCSFVNEQLPPDLSISKQATPSVVASGGTVTYTLTASNVGSVDVSNAILSDIPGAGLSCTSDGSCTPGGGATCPPSIPAATLFGAGVVVPDLPAGGSVVVRVDCTVSASGD